MDTQKEYSLSGSQHPETLSNRLHLDGTSRKIALIAWSLISLVSLISLAFSIFSLNVWDRVPAAQATTYFPDMTPQDVQNHADYQTVVLQAGFSLEAYAFIFSAARIIGGLSLFLVGFLLLRRYGDHWMAVLMAFALSVFAAAGIWGNTLFSMAVAIAPWLKYPVALLAWLLWCGVIVLYTFPDGRFTPRWMRWLAILVVPLIFFLVFDINIFLNPDKWPNPLNLLPNVIFVGGGFFALIYRYRHIVDLEQRRRIRWYVISLSLLLTAYFINFILNDLYFELSGQMLIQGYRAGMVYALINEPVWYALEVFFAVGLAISVFRNKLLEDKPG